MTVFVSYSSRDRDAVKNLTEGLQAAGEQVWMDQRLAGGEAWWRAILEQIRGCDVFIVALSQNSMESRPCQAELQYAQALDLPILPIQVGGVDSMQLNPLAAVQAIDYRHPTPDTAMRLVAALYQERARRQPLPEPLPDEPAVPFEYLIRLYTIIAGPDQLSPRDQAALVAQLQVGLREDGQHEAARKDIVMLLGKLRDREDVTWRTRTDVDAILASIDAVSATSPTAAEAAATLDAVNDSHRQPAIPPAEPSPAHGSQKKTVTDSVRIGTDPRGVAVDPGTHTVYVINFYDDTVSVIDGATRTVTATVPVGKDPIRVAVDPSTHTVYVINFYDDTVSVIDGATRTVTATVPVGKHPYGVAVDPGTHTVYVTNGADNTVSVIDGATRTVTATVPVGKHPHGVAVDPGTHTVYVTNGADNTVSVIDGTTRTVTATIRVGKHPEGVAVDPGTHTVYVTNGADNTVSVIDGATRTVTATVPVGKDPYGVAVDPDTHTLYVTNKGRWFRGTVSVIESR